MREVVPPLAPGDHGPGVGDLQEALRGLGRPVADQEVAEQAFGESTAAGVARFQGEAGLDRTGRVDAHTAAALNDRLRGAGLLPADDAAEGAFDIGVEGRVRSPAGNALGGVKVQLALRQLRDRTVLDRAAVGPDGTFRLSAPAGTPADRLQVTALSTEGTVLGASGVFVPRPQVVVDVIAEPVAATGYETLVGAISPLLGDLTIADLTEDDENQDLTFLHGETGVPADTLLRAVVAHRVEKESGIPAPAAFAVLGGSLVRNPLNSQLPLREKLAAADTLTTRAVAGIYSLNPDQLKATITGSIERGDVSAATVGAVDDTIAKIVSARVDSMLAGPFGTGKTAFRDLLASGGLSEETSRVVATRQLDSQQHDGHFWESMVTDGVLDDAAVMKVRSVIEIGSVTKNHLPMVARIRGQLAAAGDHEFSSMARRSADDWARDLRAGGQDLIPDQVVAPHEDDRITMFASEIYERMVHAYPDVATLAEVDRHGALDSEMTKAITKLCSGADKIDLRSSRIDRSLQENDAARLQQVPEALRPTLPAELRRLQRSFRLGRQPTSTVKLLASGLDSSTAITDVGRARFIDRAQELQISPVEAARIFRRAELTNALVVKTLADATSLNLPTTVTPLLQATTEQEAMLAEHPTLARLFGSQDYCSCAECNSVYSPAAYLADLLLWLRNRTMPAGSPHPTALAGLLARRPDLADIKLDCDNTDVELPYIDLVNELLEDAVAPPPAGTPARQTSGTSAERRALPQYTNDDAYTTLARANFPPQLPFDRGFDEAQVIIARLGTSLAEVTDALGAEDGTRAAQAWFGLSPATADIITGKTQLDLQQAWNLGDIAALRALPQLLRRSALDLAGLITLIGLPWIQGGTELVLDGLDDTCDTTKMSVHNLGAQHADRIQRFVRLWRHTSWTMEELDALVRSAAVGAGSLGGATLINLRRVASLMTNHGLSTSEVIGLHDELPAGSLGRPATTFVSIYDPLGPAAIRDDRLSFDAVTAPNVTATTKDAQVSVASRLGVTVAELDSLLRLAFGRSDPVTLTLGNLTSLWRWRRLAMAVSASIDELARWQQYIVVAPFTSLADTLAWFDAYAELTGLGLDVGTFEALTAPHAAVVTDAAVSATLAELRLVLGKIPESDAQVTAARAVALIPDLTDQDAQQRATQALQGAGPLDPDVLDRVVAALGESARPLFTADGHALDDAHRRQAVDDRVAALVALLGRIAVRNALADVLARSSSTSPDVVRGLLDLVHARADGQTLFEALSALTPDRATDDARPATPMDEAHVPDAFAAVRRVHAIGGAVAALGFAPSDLTWLAGRSSAEWLTPESIPSRAGESVGIEAVRRTTCLFLSLRPHLRPGRSWTELVDLVEAGKAAGTPDDQLLTEIGELIPSISLLPGPGFLDARQALGLSPDELADPKQVLRVVGTIALAARIGAPASTVRRWAVEESADVVTSMWDALRSRYTDGDWLAQLPGVTDLIRERRRDALVAYLQPRPPVAGAWTDADSMFGYFLLDVEMSACLSTSRIVQAFASVQLFVARVLMHLEKDLSGVVADSKADDGWLQWPAKSEHPLWVANLQIWHYPENWLNQIDRPGKSEPFRDLEQELAGQDVNDARVESALLHYLERLEEVARLRVVGFLDDRSTGDVHVVGRTLSQPRRHFYRTRKSGKWTPWQRLDLDIRGESVSLIIFRRRLHILWATSTIKTVQQASKSESAASKYQEIEVSWSSLRDGVWAPAMTADHFVYFSGVLGRNRVDLRLSVTARTLTAEVYLPLHVGTIHFDGKHAYAEQNPYMIQWALDNVPDAKYGQGVALTGPADQPEPGPNLAWDGSRLVSTQAAQPFSLAAGGVGLFQGANIFASVSGPFSVLGPAQDAVFDPGAPFFFEWQGRTWYVQATRYYQKGSTWVTDVPSDPLNTAYVVKLTFQRFFYPYADLFFEQLDAGGLDRLYRRELQQDPNSLAIAPTPPFHTTFQPYRYIKWGPDVDTLDYDSGSPDYLANMEPFVFAPVRIAEELLLNEKPDQALRFLGYVLDWTRPGPQTTAGRFWVPKIFSDLTDEQIYQTRLNQLLLGANSHDPAVEAQIHEWWKNPFQPFVIADMRQTAYMKNIAMRTIEAHIKNSDLAQQVPSRSSLNRSALSLITASQLLGPCPQQVKPPLLPSMSFNELVTAPGGLDDFANFTADLENELPIALGSAPTDPPAAPLPSVRSFYFKVPQNPQLLQWWDVVADRLFKLRHCQDAQGNAVRLPLLDPPVDPGLLARAAGAGVDISEILANTHAPLPHERFSGVFPRAEKFVGAVVALGHDLLQLLEKQDAEGIALLRSSQEVALADLTRAVRTHQVEDATVGIDTATRSLAVAEERRAFNAGQPKTYTGDDLALGMSVTAGILTVAAAIPKLVSGATAAIPKVEGGVSGWGAHATVATQGSALSKTADKVSEIMLLAASILDRAGTASATMASHARRYDEHQAVARQAVLEKAQIEKTIESARLKEALAKAELKQFEQQAANNVVVDTYLNHKFTAQELYSHMVGQISGLYFQAYQAAVELARRAEVCFRHELCVDDSSYVQVGHWDSLRKGLLAGERLASDLRQLEMAYHDRNKRRAEITKTVSLLQLDPVKLLTLRRTGRTSFKLTELDLDADHPGMYQRRIKSVSVTIPCVVGPYSGVHAKLELLSSSTRMSEVLTNGHYARDDSTGPDKRFLDELAPVGSIVTSSGVNDTGLFELNLNDERYLPFEGAGAISEWQLTLSQDTNSFDIETVADVLLQLRYTAVGGGGDLADKALDDVRARQAAGAVRVYDVSSDLADTWQSFLATPAEQPQVLELTLDERFVPPAMRRADVKVAYDVVFVAAAPLKVTASQPLDAQPKTTTAFPNLTGLQHVAYAGATPLGTKVSLRLTQTDGARIPAGAIETVFLFATFRPA